MTSVSENVSSVMTRAFCFDCCLSGRALGVSSIIDLNLWFCCSCPSRRLSAEACTCPEHSCLLLCFSLQSVEKRRECSSGSFFDRSLHTSVTAYCSRSFKSLAADARRCQHCLKCRKFPEQEHEETLQSVRSFFLPAAT